MCIFLYHDSDNLELNVSDDNCLSLSADSNNPEYLDSEPYSYNSELNCNSDNSKSDCEPSEPDTDHLETHAVADYHYQVAAQLEADNQLAAQLESQAVVDLYRPVYDSDHSACALDIETYRKLSNRCLYPACTTLDAPPSLHMCSRCYIARYCSQDCQNSHWLIHRQFCGKTTNVELLTFGSEKGPEY